MNDLLEDIRKHLWAYDREVYKAAAFGFALQPCDSILLLRKVFDHYGKDFPHAILPEDRR